MGQPVVPNPVSRAGLVIRPGAVIEEQSEILHSDVTAMDSMNGGVLVEAPDQAIVFVNQRLLASTTSRAVCTSVSTRCPTT